jgi:hypothetical protein
LLDYPISGLSHDSHVNPDEPLKPIDARFAELGEDGLLELKADDKNRHCREFDSETIDMIDAVRRLRIKRHVSVMTRKLHSSAHPTPNDADDALKEPLPQSLGTALTRAI